ncbi:MAG: ATPase [Clostridium sp.]|uniref:ATPase n=1 Tax=Clostridium sp. TaxID=1506 RepID=UPI0039E99BCB
MNVMKLLEYLSDIIETSTKLPMTGKSVVNKKEVCEVINDIISALPDELKKAQWIINEKDRILSDALKEADIIRRRNAQTIMKEIEKHDITKEAKINAEEIITSAQNSAKNIEIASRDYANNLLQDLDREIKEINDAMLSNIKNEMEKFLINYQKKVNFTRDTVKENIKELKKIQ